MQHHKKCGLALAIAAALATPSAFATNGYFAHGYSVNEKGLAGAGVALPQDSLAAATNPAGMVMVGERIDAGLSIFSPHRSYTVDGNPPSGAPGTFGLALGTVDSDSEIFFIPHFGWNRMLDADSSIGVSVYGNGGMNTDYPGFDNAFCGFPGAEGTFCAGNAGVDLAQLFVNVTYARKIAPTSSWGISPILAYQRFEATGLGSFAGFSSDPNNLTNKGYDSSTGYGFKIGVMGEVTPGVSLGASYQTKMSMSEFDSYKGLFAEKGGFDIPATATMGLAWKTTPTSTLAFDVQKIWYSKVRSIANSLLPNLQPGTLGNSDGAGFGWEDMTVYKLGYQWSTAQDWTWRVGYSMGDQPIPDSEVLFNILAPGVIEQHFTFGFTKGLGNNNELSFAAMYAPEKEIKGANPLEVPGQQTITLRMDQWELGASYAWKF